MTTHNVTFSVFKPADLAEIDLLDDEADVVRAGQDFLASLTTGERQHCGTARLYGRILYIGGYYETSPGVVQVFVIPDKRALLYPFALFRTVYWWRTMLESMPWVERMETFSLMSRRISKWMRKCGFTCEGETTRYTKDGKRFWLFSRSKIDGVWRR